MEQSLEKRVYELFSVCQEKCYPTFTNFLTAEQKAMICALPFIKDGNHRFFGGKECAERSILGFIPSYTENLEDDSFPIRLLKVDGSGYRELSHRDFLGSVLSLGVKRESVGDIVCDKKSYTGYIFVHENISGYISEALEKVANDKVYVYEIPFSSLPEITQENVVITDTVSSLRLDAVISACCNISRDKAHKLITSKLVSINHLVCEKKDKVLSVGELLSIKGYGRFLLKSSAENKKKRLRIEIIKHL